MPEVRIERPAPEWLDNAGQARLERRVGIALRRARASGASVLASATVPLSGAVDPTAIVTGSRGPEEHWFCLEQPHREGFALASLGSVWTLDARGSNRFSTLDRRWRAVSRAAVAEELTGPAGSGVVAVGGFAFAPDGGRSSAWTGFAPASLAVPEVSIYRRGDDARLTVTVAVEPDDTPADALERAHRSLARLRRASLPLLDPAPAGTFRVASVLPPSHYEDAVARAVERIRAGRLQKVVLAREVEV
ncbi:MAG: isochorismate synthase, partial [Solirubrobacteraceae bacterium]